MKFLKFLLIAAMMTPALAWSSSLETGLLAVDQIDPNKREIAEENLPPVIQEDIFKNYSTAVFVEAMELIDENGNVKEYEVYLEDEGRDFKIVYDSKGVPVKSETGTGETPTK